MKLTDEQIMSAACTASDALDATRVSEMRDGKWHATTIFDGDSGLLRFGRLIEQKLAAPSAIGATEREEKMRDFILGMADGLLACQSALSPESAAMMRAEGERIYKFIAALSPVVRSDGSTATHPGCSRCGAETAAQCNDKGCGFLEGQ